MTLSSVAVSRQKGRSRVNKSFMRIIWTLRNQDRPMIAFVLQSARKKDFEIANCRIPLAFRIRQGFLEFSFKYLDSDSADVNKL